MGTPHNTYALLVGIDAYPDPVPPLRGCRNDIEAIRTLLERRVAGSEDTLHVRTLLDEQATRAAVIGGFREHLARAGGEDTVLFYYSGHGSQEPAPEQFWHLEPDHLDETLVLWDSRQEGQWDLADKELAALLGEVAAGEPHILVVLDCCHSGSGTRAPLEDGIGSRRAPTDSRERPPDSFLFDPARVDDLVGVGTQRSALGGSGWSVTRARHVLLSGCRANETSKEIFHAGLPRGAMSVALESALEKAGDALSYREVHRQVSAIVRGAVRQQAPQLETSSAADLDVRFLGGALPPGPAWFAVTRVGAAWTMDGGRVHGVGAPVGAEVTTVAITDAAGSAVGTADVTQVRAGDATLSVTSGELDPTRSYRARIVATPLPPLPVRITGDPDRVGALRAALAQRREHGPALVAEAGADADPLVEVSTDADGFALTRRGGDRSLCPRAGTAADAVAMLEHVAAWSTALGLRNGTSALPRDAVTVRLAVQPDPGQTLPIEVDGGYRIEYLTSDRSRPRGYTVTLTNTTQRPLWVALLDLTDTFGIYADALENGSERIAPGESRPIELLTDVPDVLWEQGVTEVTDVLKVIVSTEEFDPRPMTQDDLAVSAPTPREAVGTRGASGIPASTLDRLLRRVGTRRARPQSAGEAAADWYTADLTVVSVRPRAGARTRPDAPTQLGAGVVLQPHPVLRATVELTTADDATRDLSVAPVPECLQGEGTMPFTLTTTRDGGHGADALLLRLDDPGSAEAVTAADPLVVTVPQPLGEGEHLLPFAWDGEFYLPLGHARPAAGGQGTDIVLQRLARPVATERSLGGSIRILLRKLVGKVAHLPPAYPQLRLATVADDGTVGYEGDPDAVRRAVTAADSVLLYVHGILGDTEGMARSSRLSGTSRPIGPGYGAVLTFDYENLDTPIEQNAAALGTMLAAAGLGGQHGKRLDIVAHSMGGLLCRHLVERIGGVEVNRLVTLGTPNGGSPWPTVQQWATAAVALAANGFIPVAWPVTALAAVLGVVEKVDTALDQMQPDSDFLMQLGQAPDPAVPYHVIVGDRSLAQPTTASADGRLARLLGRLAPARVGGRIADLVFFGRPNDLAVAVSSAQHLPPGRDPAPQVHVVATDHISFFEDRASLDLLASALSA
ncbi:caspase family protein [Intrasporangium sp.]|uniref:caspase family protein n=1 Tax=Intrasporangium sp. TaxID=1925024 RepID=UPI0032214274